jgi:ketose-bisphosphate aldolase
MPLAPAAALLETARKGGYAVGYFESWNFESLQGVIDAAEESASPIIIGFNGEFLSEPGRRTVERLAWYGALGRAAAESAAVPCAFIFNECSHDPWVELAIEAGFNLVMPADPHAPLPEYTQRVAALTRIAHARGVAVEAELGELPCGAEGEIAEGGEATDPEIAARFVLETGIDILAVSVGNVHIRLHGEGGLDLTQLERLRAAVDLPLALHGGTGIAAGPLREAIKLGVAKVNYGTYVKQRYLAAIRAALASEEQNPHELLGIGGEADVLVAGRLAVRDAVLDRIETLGCVDRAWEHGNEGG